MKIEIFNNVRCSTGVVCTSSLFVSQTDSDNVRQCAKRLQDESLSQNEKQSIKSQMLPVITWQASYKGDRRSNKNAIPSGLYMLDIDHCENEMEAIIAKAKGMREELDIVYIGRSISGKGVRIVAECQPQFSTIKECQEWLSSMLEVVYDPACKDWARASYLVPMEYIHYFDGAIFDREPKCVYRNAGDGDGAGNGDGSGDGSGTTGPSNQQINKSSNQQTSDQREPSNQQINKSTNQQHSTNQQTSDQREPLSFQGLPYSDIIAQYWEVSGEEHSEGYRNTALYKLAFALRYICDFNEATLLKVMPTLGLPTDEMKRLIHGAVSAPRSSDMPKVLRTAIETLQQLKLYDEESELMEDMPEVEKFADVFSTNEVPDLPPIFKEWYDVAPDDFKLATVLALLPFLGTVGSKLRATYFNNEVHSPSFICCVEAPQVNGKSFVRRIDNCILGSLKEHDAEEREKVRLWNEARKAERDARVKLSKAEITEMMQEKPEGLIRYVAPTISITELLRKMVNAKGLHIMAVSEEIDTVYKSLKRGFSDFSDILRKAFDNAEHGQDYASDSSWSGIVKLFFNVCYCGTPKAMRRFFPDVEDGMISRVIFVTFPDQSFKPLAQWKPFTREQLETINYHVNRLSMISLVDNEVQDDHMLKMDFMVKEMGRWCTAQQKLAAVNKDLTRDTFCRRSAVIGFRAAMLAYFLWGESKSPVIRARVKKFGVWVANCCLRQFITRFDLNGEDNNVKYNKAYESLPEVFTWARLECAMRNQGYKAPIRQVIYKWRLAGVIEDTGNKKEYRKVKNG